MTVFPGICPEHTPREITRWRNEHFGFSGALYLRFPRHGEPVEYRFLARPGPPIAWLRRVAAAWPGLTFALDYALGGIREREVRYAVESEAPEVAGRVGPLALAA